MAITVTATQGGSTKAGLVLRVFVITGATAAAGQTGGSAAAQIAAAAMQVTVTTTQAGSRTYGTFSSNNTAPAANANTTLVDDITDLTNSERYDTFKAVGTTGTPQATAFGSTVTASGPIAVLEILKTATLAEDASGPAVVSTTAATTLTTASFTPPAGSLLVALIGSDGSTGIATYTVSDSSGLTWTEKIKNNPTGGDYAGVWIADAGGPAGPGMLPQPGGRAWRRRYHRRQTAVSPGQPPFEGWGVPL